MNKKLIDILERVLIINKLGGDLKFEIDGDMQLQIWDHSKSENDDKMSVMYHLFGRSYIDSANDEMLDKVIDYLRGFIYK